MKILEVVLEEEVLLDPGFMCVLLDPSLDPYEARSIREEVEYWRSLEHTLETLRLSKNKESRELLLELEQLLNSSGFKDYMKLELKKTSRERRRQEKANEIYLAYPNLTFKERHQMILDAWDKM